MDDRPPNLKTMLSEAKDTSELMVDLAYAAVYFLAARSPRDADAMASVLQVVSAIERIGNAAVDIGHIVTHRLGIPRALVADLSEAEEISHRVRVRDGSEMAYRPLADIELPVEVGMRVVAIRRDREW